MLPENILIIINMPNLTKKICKKFDQIILQLDD